MGSAQKCLSVCLSVGCPQLFFEPLVWLGKIFSTKTRENEYVKILILEFRGYPPRVDSGAKSTWLTIFIQFLQKVYFCKDKFILQSVILAEFWNFSLGIN